MQAHAAFLERIAQCPDGRRIIDRPLDAGDWCLLGKLRMLACKARIDRRLDLDRVPVHADPTEKGAFHGEVLLRALAVVALRPVVFYRSINTAPSFDELWLLRLIRLLQQGDEAGARFLIAGRIHPRTRHQIINLARQFAHSLEAS